MVAPTSDPSPHNWKARLPYRPELKLEDLDVFQVPILIEEHYQA
jgi:hypothetical protein